ncbi:stalk domain-containing protein [Agathobaculum sp.]|uniref:stalk domain-containing protein n=1 Tax=Agathobaculum sp. TaxID=2048138 RepID=UPI002A7F9A4F|nr:stalk domain-containing protein [Agathobaculum sp.]MDY3618542.1 stalk domain-containing protein [Agathobaculum sp.]
MKKRFIAVLLSAAMLSVGMLAGAADDQTSQTASVYSPYSIGEQATVIKMLMKSGLYSEMTVKTDTYEKLVLHFGPDTLLMDTQTGTMATESDIKDGDKVFVYYDEAMNQSEPPQTGLQAVLVNLDDKKTPAHLLTAESIVYNTNSGPTVQAENGTLLLTLPANVPISPLATKQVASLGDIRMGTRFFAWYDAVALSMPGQATAAKVVLPPQNDQNFTIIHEGDIAIAEGRIEHGVAMVPARKVAETLGFKVTWNGKDQSVHLANDTRQTTVYLGEDLYNYSSVQAIGMSAPMSLGAAAYEVDGVSWVPAELFALLLGENSLQLIDTVLYL